MWCSSVSDEFAPGVIKLTESPHLESLKVPDLFRTIFLTINVLRRNILPNNVNSLALLSLPESSGLFCPLWCIPSPIEYIYQYARDPHMYSC